MAPLGKAREWIEQNRQLPRAGFWTAEVGLGIFVLLLWCSSLPTGDGTAHAGFTEERPLWTMSMIQNTTSWIKQHGWSLWAHLCLWLSPRNGWSLHSQSTGGFSNWHSYYFRWSIQGSYLSFISAIQKSRVTRTCSSLMIKEFNASHWIMSEAPDELNEALDQFFHSVESKAEHCIE